MSNRDTAFAYHQFAALGASPVEQVVALYDRIIRDFHTCIAAISAGNIEKRVNASNHALTIIGELQGVLDFAQGEVAARNLNSFYTVTRPMITQASISNSSLKFQELIAMYGRIRAAWSHVASTIPEHSAGSDGESHRSPRAETTPASVATASGRARKKTSQRVSATRRDSEDFSTGRWSA